MPTNGGRPTAGGVRTRSIARRHRARCASCRRCGPLDAKGNPFLHPRFSRKSRLRHPSSPVAATSPSAHTAPACWGAAAGKDWLLAAYGGSNCTTLPRNEGPSHPHGYRNAGSGAAAPGGAMRRRSAVRGADSPPRRRDSHGARSRAGRRNAAGDAPGTRHCRTPRSEGVSAGSLRADRRLSWERWGRFSDLRMGLTPSGRPDDARECQPVCGWRVLRQHRAGADRQGQTGHERSKHDSHRKFRRLAIPSTGSVLRRHARSGLRAPRRL